MTIDLPTPTMSRPEAGLIRLWRDPSIRVPFIIFITTRFLTLLIAYTAAHLGPVTNPYANDPIFLGSLKAVRTDGLLYSVVEPWHRWDTGWYLKIAQEGYRAGDGSIIFGPLYPMLIALVGGLVGDGLLASLLISSAACLVFLILLYKLAFRETRSHTAANYALLALVAFPTAFYLLAGYTESLYLALVAGALLAGFARRWWLAAFLAAATTLTRLQGWALFFPLGWLAFLEVPRFWQTPGATWPERLRAAVPRLAATGAAPLIAMGSILYPTLAGLGSIDAAYEKPWGMYIRPPWTLFIDLFNKILAGRANATEFGGLAALALIIALCLASLRTLPVVYHAYLWPTLVLILLRYYPLYLLNGTMRYVLDFFPIFITAGVWLTRRHRIRLVWLVVGAFLQMWILFLFARWLWIS